MACLQIKQMAKVYKKIFRQEKLQKEGFKICLFQMQLDLEYLLFASIKMSTDCLTKVVQVHTSLSGHIYALFICT